MKSKSMSALLLLGSMVVLFSTNGCTAKQLAKQPSTVVATSGTELTNAELALPEIEATDEDIIDDMDD